MAMMAITTSSSISVNPLIRRHTWTRGMTHLPEERVRDERTTQKTL
jgi:hypothetical protein